MKLRFSVSILATTGFALFGETLQSNVAPRERIRVVRHDISKWDKNGDGKLTGGEKDGFLAAKRKEMADAAAAAAKTNHPALQRPNAPRPALSPEDAQKPTPKGVPKNLEDAGK